MKYYIDQKFAVPWADYDVLADDGNAAFRVKSHVSLGMDVASEADVLTVLLLMLAVSAIREETHAAQLTSFIP